MNTKLLVRRVAAIIVLMTMLAPVFTGLPPATITTETVKSPSVTPAQSAALKVVFDYSHGQFSTKLYNTTDQQLAENLTALGYSVVWAYGGI
ncbi:MAG: hypothetical protein ACTSVT_06215, partial [Candidatus Thorarchaeota archaeon]